MTSRRCIAERAEFRTPAIVHEYWVSRTTIRTTIRIVRWLMAHFDRARVGEDEFAFQIGTLSGNPVASVAGLATMKILKEPGAIEKIHQTGRTIMAALSEHFERVGIPVQVVKVADAGRYRIVDTRHGDTVIRLLVAEGEAVPGDAAHLRFDPDHTQVYADGWMIT